MSLKIVAISGMLLCLGACNGDRGHYGTPSDPNEQQGNPQAKPEKSIKGVSNGEADGNKAGKDPHTLTQDNSAGQPQKK